MRGGGSPTPANGNMQGRLAAWNASSSPSSGHHLAPPRDQYSDRQRVPSEGQSLRQTAISVTSGFAPAAFGFGKRAVEKMGRAWGGLTSSSSSGHSSSSSSIAPSSFSGGHPLGRVHSNQSTSSQSNASGSFPSKHKQRRTPNAPSATWSISSSATGSSLSEGEQFPAASVGPSLGKRMRGPLRLLNSSSAAATGLVFGRDLKSCVQETAINPARFRRDDDESVHNGGHRRQRSRGLDMELVGAKALEDRMLPALVVRCAQHLLRWGIEEEGLFRISGRSSHINKLRAEFDTGADYDISDCSPGDLDPHAVASIFKAYLRELPEPILTHALTPYFDAAMMAENNARSAEEPSEPRMQRASRGPTLPAGPRSGHPGLRKPPSLSTLAMPNFSGIRPPSQPLLNALSSLISRLPPENRDLLRTVTELIKETAKRHKDTKMPLSNLLLVFCPSLSMSPSLLRVLCEAEGIWDGPLKSADDPYIIDIKADPSPVIDIRSEDDDAADSDGEDGQDGESSAAQEMPSDRDSLPGEDDEGESESDDDEVVQFPTVVERKIMRPSPASPGQSSVVRTPSPLAASSPAPSRGDSIYAPGVSPSDSSSYKDDAASYVSASDVPSSDASERMYNPYSPRALTSSADSLATPSTMSDDPSLPQVPGAAPEKPLPSFEAFSSPKIADNSNLPLPPTETSNPVPFPSEAEMTKRDPIAERSRPLAVSMVNQMLEYDEHSRSPTGTSPSPRMTRVKKPSLHLLFTKRKSGSSPSPVSSPLRRSGVQAISPYLHTAATSTSSVSTPITAVTAPQASTFSLPPKLDLSIESSPIDLNIPVAGGAKASSLDQASDLASPGESSESTGTITQSIFPLQERTMSSISSSTYESSRSHETPIADMYCSGSSSPAPSVQAPSALGKSGSASQSQVSLTPSSYDKLHVGVHDSNDEPEEDWAGSVLKAAQSGLSDREGTAAGASR
ncbi:RhoGAP-domain-containing protein, partial [Gloeophyllum trabeum ATCC 11539]